MQSLRDFARTGDSLLLALDRLEAQARELRDMVLRERQVAREQAAAAASAAEQRMTGADEMTPAQVAACLHISRSTLYHARPLVACLSAAKIKRGNQALYVTAAVLRHKDLEAEYGRCPGTCGEALRPKRGRRGKLLPLKREAT